MGLQINKLIPASWKATWANNRAKAAQAQRARQIAEKKQARTERKLTEERTALQKAQLQEREIREQTENTQRQEQQEAENTSRPSWLDKPWVKYTGIAALLGIPVTAIAGYFYNKNNSPDTSHHTEKESEHQTMPA